MVSSILTNNGAMTALQSLKATQKNLLDTQNRISTGLKVSTAKDNAATWAVATSMRSDIANFKQVSENLSVSSAVVATGRSATEQMTDLVKQIRTKITAAQNSAVDASQIQADIDQLTAQINSTADAASYKGVNLINNTGTERMLSSVNDVNGAAVPSYITVGKTNLTTGGSLSQLNDISVVGRGDQLFSAVTDGTRAVTFGGFATAAQAGTGTFTVNYTDRQGVAKSLTVSGLTTAGVDDAGALATALNANADFAALFKVAGTDGGAGGADGQLVLQAKDRDLELGEFKITSISGNTLSTGVSAAGAVQSVELNFQSASAAPLKEGDTFSLDFTVDGSSRRVVLEVGSGTTDLISTEGSVERIRLNIDEVDGAATAADVANFVRDALNKSNFIDTAAASSASLQVSATAGKLTITSDNDALTGISHMATPTTDYETLLDRIDSVASTITNVAASLGSVGQRIDMQKDFMDKLVDTLTSGVGALVDADMSEEAARLQALQVQEQLGTQALSIANQAPQSILSLFRG
ncbi:flagellin [Teichococcus vastitatis]|uniref:Flagellin n=1 Tax=Teichococcus vastitatis TaxID=2307076 RepID=A0ABS9W6D6_9PROT|nr:flagellin [Pseudoroseomonas vastitatis]MCI0754783.1 flagellin [Pseudoroseomonas vastitatis]